MRERTEKDSEVMMKRVIGRLLLVILVSLVMLAVIVVGVIGVEMVRYGLESPVSSPIQVESGGFPLFEISCDSLISCPDGLAYGRFYIENTGNKPVKFNGSIYDPEDGFVYYRDGWNWEAITFIGEDECPPGNTTLAAYESAYVALPLIVPNPGPATLDYSICVAGGLCYNHGPIDFSITEEELTALGVEPIPFHETQTSFEISDVTSKMDTDGNALLIFTLHNTGSNILWKIETIITASTDDTVILTLSPDNIGNEAHGTLFPGESVEHPITLKDVNQGETYEAQFKLCASNTAQWCSQKTVSFTIQ
jgi:hypothetical protein